MPGTERRSSLRARLALPPFAIAALFAIYLVSQIAIARTLHPLGASIARLQVAAFDAATVREIFQGWIDAGVMDAYRAHFRFDDLHPLWYAAFGTTLLARLFERRGVAHRHDWVLALPAASALCDVLENTIQHRFLALPDLAAIPDALALASTLASLTKWGLIAIWLGVAIALSLRPRRARVG